jgi:hypothetical protein
LTRCIPGPTLWVALTVLNFTFFQIALERYRDRAFFSDFILNYLLLHIFPFSREPIAFISYRLPVTMIQYGFIKPVIQYPTVVIPAKAGHLLKHQRYPGG